MRARWDVPLGRFNTHFAADLPSEHSSGRPYTQISLRVGYTPADFNNWHGSHDFSLLVQDAFGQEHLVVASDSSAAELLFDPEYMSPVEEEFSPYYMVMQTIRFSLGTFTRAGVDTTRIRKVELMFNRRFSGLVYVDDLQLTL
jgi:hypothetical protein